MGKRSLLRRIGLPLLWVAIAVAPSRRPKPPKPELSKEEQRKANRESIRRAGWDVNKYNLWLAAVIAVPLAAVAATMPVHAALLAIGVSEDTSTLVSLVPGLGLLIAGWFLLGRTAVRSFRKDFL